MNTEEEVLSKLRRVGCNVQVQSVAELKALDVLKLAFALTERYETSFGHNVRSVSEPALKKLSRVLTRMDLGHLALKKKELLSKKKTKAVRMLQAVLEKLESKFGGDLNKAKLKRCPTASAATGGGKAAAARTQPTQDKENRNPNVARKQTNRGGKPQQKPAATLRERPDRAAASAAPKTVKSSAAADDAVASPCRVVGGRVLQAPATGNPFGARRGLARTPPQSPAQNPFTGGQLQRSPEHAQATQPEPPSRTAADDTHEQQQQQHSRALQQPKVRLASSPAADADIDMADAHEQQPRVQKAQPKQQPQPQTQQPQQQPQPVARRQPPSKPESPQQRRQPTPTQPTPTSTASTSVVSEATQTPHSAPRRRPCTSAPSPSPRVAPLSPSSPVAIVNSPQLSFIEKAQRMELGLQQEMQELETVRNSHTTLRKSLQDMGIRCESFQPTHCLAYAQLQLDGLQHKFHKARQHQQLRESLASEQKELDGIISMMKNCLP